MIKYKINNTICELVYLVYSPNQTARSSWYNKSWPLLK